MGVEVEVGVGVKVGSGDMVAVAVGAAVVGETLGTTTLVMDGRVLTANGSPRPHAARSPNDSKATSQWDGQVGRLTLTAF